MKQELKQELKQQPVLIWDLATRFFHWALVAALAVSVYTGLDGGLDEMDVHMLSGYTIFGLLIFRIVWGFIGSRYARFQAFLRGPGAVIDHLAGLRARQPTTHAGHNPLGALAILAMLAALVFQAVTGLFANDDIMLEGPLTHLVSYETSRMLTSWHKTNYLVIAGLAGLHLCAVGLYAMLIKEPLIRPMLTGYKWLPDSTEPARHLLPRALVTAALAAALVYSLVTWL